MRNSGVLYPFFGCFLGAPGSRGASIKFLFVDGEVLLRQEGPMELEGKVLTKLTNLAKKLRDAWLNVFFADMEEIVRIIGYGILVLGRVIISRDAQRVGHGLSVAHGVQQFDDALGVAQAVAFGYGPFFGLYRHTEGRRGNKRENESLHNAICFLRFLCVLDGVQGFLVAKERYFLEKKEARLLFPASFPSYQPSYLAQY